MVNPVDAQVPKAAPAPAVGEVRPPAADTSIAVVDTITVRPDTVLTLDQALALALQVSPTETRAQASIQVSHAAERTAVGELLPTLGLTAAVLHNGLGSIAGVTSGSGADTAGLPGSSSPGTGSLSGSSPSSSSGSTVPIGSNAYAILSAGWDVFTGGRRSADIRRAREDIRASNATEVQQRFTVLSAVKSAFYDVLRAEDMYGVAVLDVRRARQDVYSALRRHAVGTATTADVLQFEQELSSARQSLMQAILDRRSASYALGRLTGVGPSVEARRPSNLEPTPLALPDTAIVSLALREAPTMLAARDSAIAAEASLASVRTEYVPTLHADAAYTWAHEAAELSGIRGGWSVSLSTTYPIFDGFRRQYDVERATAALNVARSSAADAERQARAEALRLIGAVRLAAEQVRLAEGGVVVAQENYRVESTRYSVGVASSLDLTIVAQALVQAEQQMVNARYDYQTTRADLETLVGRTL